MLREVARIESLMGRGPALTLLLRHASEIQTLRIPEWDERIEAERKRLETREDGAVKA